MNNPDLIIKDSLVEGKGVFANRFFKKDEKVFFFPDKIIYIDHKKGCDCDICKRCIQIGEYRWIYPKEKSYGWNLNHNCEPSCYIGRDNFIYALRDIKKEEEITIDYSTSTRDFKWKMKCNCNSENCRKTILSVQHLSLEIFKKFIGKMPEYIEKGYKINS